MAVSVTAACLTMYEVYKYMISQHKDWMFVGILIMFLGFMSMLTVLSIFVIAQEYNLLFSMKVDFCSAS